MFGSELVGALEKKSICSYHQVLGSLQICSRDSRLGYKKGKLAHAVYFVLSRSWGEGDARDTHRIARLVVECSTDLST